MKKYVKKIATVTALVLIFALFPFVPFPKTSAAPIIVYTNSYTYVKPAPYWTCDPFDELSAGYQVTIIERDYNFFYIEYFMNGQVHRGYAPMSNFDSSAYAGYSWVNHNRFTPAKNKTDTSITVYYGASTTYHAVSGSIDGDEGENPEKPLTLLHVDGDWAFVQYVTNTGETGHPKFNRGWVQKEHIAIEPTDEVDAIDKNNFATIKNVGTGKYLTLTSDSEAESNFGLSFLDSTGLYPQHWHLPRSGDATNGYQYKMIAYNGDLAWEVDTKIPVLDLPVITTMVNVDEPNKAQEYYIEQTDDEDDTYWIKTRCSGGFLALEANAAGTGVYQKRYDPNSDRQKWVIDTFKYYYEDYTHMNVQKINGISQIKYYVVTSGENAISKAHITKSVVNEAASNWNSHKEKTGVELVEVGLIDDAHFTVESMDLGSTLGQTVSGRIENLAGERDYYYYNMRAYIGAGNLQHAEYNEKVFVVGHELGHAMGLKHAPSVGNQYTYLSIMNEGNAEATNPQYRKKSPSHYDIQTLQCNWRGAKNG